jgi:hypothetical protein
MLTSCDVSDHRAWCCDVGRQTELPQKVDTEFRFEGESRDMKRKTGFTTWPFSFFQPVTCVPVGL